jgi:hypothetical protein
MRGDALAPTVRPHPVTQITRKITKIIPSSKQHEERPANVLSPHFFSSASEGK